MAMDEDALLIGFDDSIMLTIYLDYKNNDTIYIKMGNVAASVLERKTFEKLLNFLRLTKSSLKRTKIGKAKLLSPKSMASEGHVWIFENGTLKITYRGFVKTMSVDAYYLFLEQLEISKNGLVRYDKVKALDPRAREAMGIDEVGRSLGKDKLYKIRVAGYSLVIVTFAVNSIFFFTTVFNLQFLPLSVAIYLIIVEAYLLLPASEKKSIAMFRANSKDYINEDMLKNLEGLPISRKGVEFFMILLMAIVFMATYFSKAIPGIMKWGNHLFGESAEMVDMDDITKVASMFKTNIVDNYDIKRKFFRCNKVLSILFKTASKHRITIQSANTNFQLGGGFLTLKVNGFIFTKSPNNFNAFKNEISSHKPFTYCDGSRLDDKYKFELVAKFNLSSSKWFMRMKYKKSTAKRIRRKIEKSMKMRTGKNTRQLFGVTTKKHGKQVAIVGIEGTTDTYQAFTGFVKSIETLPEILQCLPTKISFYNGKYIFSLTAVCCYR